MQANFFKWRRTMKEKKDKQARQEYKNQVKNDLLDELDDGLDDIKEVVRATGGGPG
jgi:hypothetical protein